MVNLTETAIVGMIAFAVIIVASIYLAIRLIRRSKSGREIRQFNELVQHFIESDDIPVFLKDERLRYLFVNPPMQEIFGEESASIVGKSDFDLMDVEKAQQQWNSDKIVIEQRTFATDELMWEGDLYRLTKFPVALDNNLYGVGAYVSTATRKTREKYLKTLLALDDGVMILDQDGKLEVLNHRAEMMTGWSTEEAQGMHYKDVLILIHENPEAMLIDPIRTVFTTKQTKELESHAILLSRTGENYHLEDTVIPIKDQDEQLSGVVMIFRDITEQKRKNQELEYQTFHDSLTGLYNRRYFEEEVKRLDTERNLPLSVIMGDMDGLKLTNDIFGHNAGDELLRKVSDVFKKVCRADDIIARWGGDEFAILLPQTKHLEALNLSERIRSNLKKEEVKGIKGEVSMGVATKEKTNENIYQKINQAEESMYTEKTMGKGKGKEETFKIIINSLYSEFPEEAKHAKRTAELSKKICKKMKLPLEEVNKAGKAAYLHDIGKVALDREVIRKSEYGEEEGFKEMQQHPLIGFRILNAFEHTIDLASIVLAHHERFDGSGYPQGLRGKEIPRLARVIAVAERFDAMTAKNDGREALSKEDAIWEIKRNKHTHYDPNVVEALELVLQDN
jgi:diguanylate cyclase (GGDEF)-like protein/PAS domain S-box-containing protein/putative nucleotidyltransferase with HDIG domain